MTKKAKAQKPSNCHVDIILITFYALANLEYEKTLPLMKSCVLPKWVHNKAIQKARESYRITKEQKEYLNTLKIKQA